MMQNIFSIPAVRKWLLGFE